jgi:hypothetical protein
MLIQKSISKRSLALAKYLAVAALSMTMSSCNSDGQSPNVTNHAQVDSNARTVEAQSTHVLYKVSVDVKEPNAKDYVAVFYIGDYDQAKMEKFMASAVVKQSVTDISESERAITTLIDFDTVEQLAGDNLNQYISLMVVQRDSSGNFVFTQDNNSFGEGTEIKQLADVLKDKTHYPDDDLATGGIGPISVNYSRGK